MTKQHRERVVAVFTAYRPDDRLVQHVISALPQVAKVIVVDDGSGPQFAAVLTELEQLGALVCRQPDNLGIAAATNEGFRQAQQLGAELVVTFDQDSQVPEGYVDALVNAYDQATAAGLMVAMVAPEWYSLTHQAAGREQGVLMAYAPIQSGLLMPVNVINELGEQRTEFFIDLVETEYYFRAASRGFVAVCAEGLTLPHGFGHRLFVHAFGRRLRKADGAPRMVNVSSPFRYYYRARNRRVLNRMYRSTPELHRMLRRDGRRDLLLDYLVAIWSAKGKFKLASLIVAGWRDAAKGSMGKMPDHLAARAGHISWRHPAQPVD